MSWVMGHLLSLVMGCVKLCLPPYAPLNACFGFIWQIILMLLFKQLLKQIFFAAATIQAALLLCCRFLFCIDTLMHKDPDASLHSNIKECFFTVIATKIHSTMKSQKKYCC